MKQLQLISFLILLLTNCLPLLAQKNNSISKYEVKDNTGKTITILSDTKGTLDEKSYDNLISQLNEISSSKIDKSKNIIINYIDDNPRINNKNYQVPWDIFNRNLSSKLNKTKQCSHFWVINKKVTNLYYYHVNKINWLKDQNSIIKKIFFNYESLNGGFVIIKPNKEYYLKNGEYSKKELLSVYKDF